MILRCFDESAGDHQPPGGGRSLSAVLEASQGFVVPVPSSPNPPLPQRYLPTCPLSSQEGREGPPRGLPLLKRVSQGTGFLSHWCNNRWVVTPPPLPDVMPQFLVGPPFPFSGAPQILFLPANLPIKVPFCGALITKSNIIFFEKEKPNLTSYISAFHNDGGKQRLLTFSSLGISNLT